MSQRGMINGLQPYVGNQSTFRYQRNRALVRRCTYRIATCVAVIAIAVLLILLYSSDEELPVRKVQPLAPAQPYVLYGYVYDSTYDIVPLCELNMSNSATEEYALLVSDTNGYYQYNLANLPSGYSLGDLVELTSESDSYTGSNQTTVTGTGGKWFNISVVEFVIPEFSTVVVPMTVTLFCVVFMTITRRKGHGET